MGARLNEAERARRRLFCFFGESTEMEPFAISILLLLAAAVAWALAYRAYRMCRSPRAEDRVLSCVLWFSAVVPFMFVWACAGEPELNTKTLLTLALIVLVWGMVDASVLLPL